jgi:hypothetical protein
VENMLSRYIMVEFSMQVQDMKILLLKINIKVQNLHIEFLVFALICET